MQLQGRVQKLLPLRSGVSQRTGNEWRVQEFVLEYFESPSDIYACRVVLRLSGTSIDELSLREGDEVVARVRLSSREYEGRLYNEIVTGKVEVVKRMKNPSPAQGSGSSAAQGRIDFAQQQQQSRQPQQAAAGAESSQPGGQGGEDDDDLPF